MSTQRTSLNVEKGKQGFQETSKAQPSSPIGGLGTPDVGAARVADMIGERLHSRDGFYARGDYVEFGDDGASYGVESGDQFYRKMLGPSSEGGWDDATAQQLDSAICEIYGCESTGDDWDNTSFEFPVSYNDQQAETIEDLGNRVEAETKMLEFLNDSTYGTTAEAKVAAHLGWRHEKYDGAEADEDGYAYMKTIEHDGRAYSVPAGVNENGFGAGTMDFRDQFDSNPIRSEG